MAIQAGAIRPSGYETTFITRAELSDDALKTLQDKVASIIANYQGEVVLTEDWGKRKLAYSIQKESRGHYTYMVYTGRGEVVQEIERNLRIHDHVLRFLSVNLDREFDAESFKTQRAAYHEASKRREAEREARREERERERRGYGDDDRRGGYDRGGYGDEDRRPRSSSLSADDSMGADE